MMVHILIPDNNIEERKYSAKIVFDTVMGIGYDIVPVKMQYETVVKWDNKSIYFKDAFWNFGGCKLENLPKVNYSKNDFIPEKDIPVLYGNEKLSITDDEIVCGIDVFASIFFMLTRWEEYVVKKRDIHNRFIGKESIAFKYGFLCRPIVNEYIEMIWNMMQYLGFKEKRKPRKFEIVLTHDIDHPFFRSRFREVSYNIKRCLQNHDFKSIPTYIKYYFIDPYNTYDFLMEVSESIGVKSHFYLMSVDESITEYKNSPYLISSFKKKVDMIKRRGHVIGFHPGYFSVIEEKNWKKEKEKLTEFLGQVPEEGRQHYLMFNMPETFSFWENNGMKLDSTLSYPDAEGFRCGTGDIFPVFNFMERKEYKLQERPLIIMDGTLLFYQGYSLEKISEILNYYFEISKKYQMPITLLFHNSIFIGIKGRDLKKLYLDILRKSVQ